MRPWWAGQRVPMAGEQRLGHRLACRPSICGTSQAWRGCGRSAPGGSGELSRGQGEPRRATAPGTGRRVRRTPAGVPEAEDKAAPASLRDAIPIGDAYRGRRPTALPPAKFRWPSGPGKVQRRVDARGCKWPFSLSLTLSRWEREFAVEQRERPCRRFAIAVERVLRRGQWSARRELRTAVANRRHGPAVLPPTRGGRTPSLAQREHSCLGVC